MFCKNCGAQIPDGSVFCTECGTRVQEEPVQEPVQEEPVQPEYVPPVQEPVQPEYTPVEQPVYTAEPQPASGDLNDTPILITGILAIALCWTGIGGLICAIINKSKVKKFLAAGGVLAGKAKVGKILGTVGLILSILYIVFWVGYICWWIIWTIIAAAGGLSNYTSSYWY
ncbi:MAG: zinc-ribbon domain-containing protein [Clostridia bacterium]|nr:zinc-ribbon domain-containing protein [Clostridia bacterium]